MTRASGYRQRVETLDKEGGNLFYKGGKKSQGCAVSREKKITKKDLLRRKNAGPVESNEKGRTARAAEEKGGQDVLGKKTVNEGKGPDDVRAARAPAVLFGLALSTGEGETQRGRGLSPRFEHGAI